MIPSEQPQNINCSFTVKLKALFTLNSTHFSSKRFSLNEHNNPDFVTLYVSVEFTPTPQATSMNWLFRFSPKIAGLPWRGVFFFTYRETISRKHDFHHLFKAQYIFPSIQLAVSLTVSYLVSTVCRSNVPKLHYPYTNCHKVISFLRKWNCADLKANPYNKECSNDKMFLVLVTKSKGISLPLKKLCCKLLQSLPKLYEKK